ncbi:hypothetical protein PMAYCL1PPCAC_00522 [Pristionchus mayeri]|uniref:Uncharacterized protein n=1 Tax=Pristionchus mayeri TaxID=1317129 RepID=A0AAN4Z2S5_9BILA|nr:hypothetical protein PMAYCL1PPCAC_00522 [Pristionchus mayeri]
MFFLQLEFFLSCFNLHMLPFLQESFRLIYSYFNIFHQITLFFFFLIQFISQITHFLLQFIRLLLSIFLRLSRSQIRNLVQLNEHLPLNSFVYRFYSCFLQLSRQLSHFLLQFIRLLRSMKNLLHGF